MRISGQFQSLTFLFRCAGWPPDDIYMIGIFFRRRRKRLQFGIFHRLSQHIGPSIQATLDRLGNLFTKLPKLWLRNTRMPGNGQVRVRVWDKGIRAHGVITSR